MILYPYQRPSADALTRALQKYRVAVDASDTGTGKGIVGCEVVRRVSGPVAVVCPRLMCDVWQENLRAFGIEPLFCIGYEKLRAGGTPWGKFELKRWQWNLPADTLIVFDEIHRAKSPSSLNARIVMASKPFRVLGLSATIAQSPLDLRAVGYLLGLHNWTGFWKFCLRNGCSRGAFGQLVFNKRTAQKVLLNLHAQIFPEKGSRIRIAELGDAFPENFVTAECIAFDNADQVTAAYDEAATLLNEAILRGENATSAVFAMKARQKAEILKAEGLAQMAADLVEEGNSVVLFVSFRETLEKIRVKLKCGGIYGGQNERERQRAIADFQADKSRVIICNVQAGSQGISLQDIHGCYPRVSIITPTFHAIDLRQCLGRIHRAGAKSKAVQKLVFSRHTPEERIFKRVQAKLNNVDLINDGDLDSFAELAEQKTPVAELSTANLRSTENKVSETSCEVADTSYSAVLSSPATIETTQPVLRTERSEERKHAPLSPSVLKSKAICPGYFSDPDGDRTFADRGTLAHKAVETEDLSLVAHDNALKAAVEKCISYKNELTQRKWREGKVELHQEVRLEYAGEQWGYCDLVYIVGDEAHLTDYKFAYNWYAADTPQFWAYCIGVWDRWPLVEKITVHVPHPLRDEIDIETFTRSKDYDRLSGQVAAIIARARANRPEDYTVSAQCQYCGFAGKCTKLANLGLEIARRYSPELDLPEGSLHGSEITDPEAFATLMQIAPAVTKAASGWKSAALYMHESGTEIPGYEIAEKRGRRSVVSAKAAFDVIKTEVAPELKADDFVEYCDIKASAVDDLVKAVSKRGQKAKAVQRVQDLLIEGDIFNQAGDVRYLKPIRK